MLKHLILLHKFIHTPKHAWKLMEVFLYLILRGKYTPELIWDLLFLRSREKKTVQYNLYVGIFFIAIYIGHPPSIEHWMRDKLFLFLLSFVCLFFYFAICYWKCEVNDKKSNNNTQITHTIYTCEENTPCKWHKGAIYNPGWGEGKSNTPQARLSNV